jgi:hypothetical protein
MTGLHLVVPSATQQRLHCAWSTHLAAVADIIVTVGKARLTCKNHASAADAVACHDGNVGQGCAVVAASAT